VLGGPSVESATPVGSLNLERGPWVARPIFRVFQDFRNVAAARRSLGVMENGGEESSSPPSDPRVG